MEDILPIADLFLLTSEYESFGLAALEAMAAEVPVLSTNAGGLPEINVNGYSGFMSNVGDVADMSKNALTILKDDISLKTFKANALAQAKKFDIDKIVPEYEALYKPQRTGGYVIFEQHHIRVGDIAGRVSVTEPHINRPAIF